MLFVLALIVALLWIPSPWDWALVGTAAVIEIGESFFWLWWNRRRRPQVGIETLIGRRATVAAACRPAGQVRVDGERLIFEPVSEPSLSLAER